MGTKTPIHSPPQLQQSGDIPKGKSPARRDTVIEDYRFKLEKENIEALKKGKILGFPAQLGDDEDKERWLLVNRRNHSYLFKL